MSLFAAYSKKKIASLITIVPEQTLRVSQLYRRSYSKTSGLRHLGLLNECFLIFVYRHMNLFKLGERCMQYAPTQLLVRWLPMRVREGRGFDAGPGGRLDEGEMPEARVLCDVSAR